MPRDHTPDLPLANEVDRSGSPPERQPVSGGPSLLRNAGINTASRVILIALSIVSTPIMVHRLGPAGYGVLVLAVTFGGLGALLDLGLTPALINSLSYALHHEGKDAVSRILGTAFSLYLGLGLAAGAALALLSPFIVTSVFHVPLDIQAAATTAMQLSAVGLALNLWLAVFNAVPFALERYELVGARQVGVVLVLSAAFIVYALLGGTLIGFAAINVVGTGVGVVLFYFVSRRLLPGVEFRPRFDTAAARRLGRFSAFKLAGSLAGFLFYRFDQIAIGAFVGVVAAGLYAIPSNGLARLQAVIVDMVAPLFPRVSRERTDIQAVAKILLNSTRILNMVALSILVPTFVLADVLLRQWIGGSEGALLSTNATVALRLLAISISILALAATPFVLCEAIGRPEIPNGFSVASAIIHVPLIFILVPRFGITGAALALLLNSATQTVVFILFAATRIFRLQLAELLSQSIARPTLAALGTGAIGWLIRPAVHGRLSLVAALAGLWLLYLFLALVVGALTRADLRQLAGELDKIAGGRSPRAAPVTDSVDGP
jgi:O-antigen/teichoic acid export membrane protein